MFLMYVDESGDPGLDNSPTEFFILTGLVVHESRWGDYLDSLVDFRQRLRTSFGLLMREEIHASHMISKPGGMVRIPRNDRLSILRFLADHLAGMGDLRLINVVVSKKAKPPGYPVFEQAWQALIQRFENTMVHFLRESCGRAVRSSGQPWPALNLQWASRTPIGNGFQGSFGLRENCIGALGFTLDR